MFSTNQTERTFHMIMNRHLPNVAEEYVYAFYLTCKKRCFLDLLFFRWFNPLPWEVKYYLVIKFTDGNFYKCTISEHDNELYKSILDIINHYLKEKRMQVSNE